MLARGTLSIVLAAGFALAGGSAPAADEVQQAKQLIEKRMAERKAVGGQVAVLSEAPLGKLFPGQVFVGVRFRQFPVARPLPEGIKPFNLFAVKGTKVESLSDAKAVEKFFQTTLPPVKDDATAKDAVRAWLALVQEQRNDGYFKFKRIDDSLKAMPDKNGRRATGSVMAVSGGNGEVTVAMTFDAAGKLTQVVEGGKLKSGPRPICQATKLLDPDPIVRRMAEQDLLCMGRQAKEYLAEQRAKARPELQRAIDRIWQRIQEE
jgi:hypothetical protein